MKKTFLGLLIVLGLVMPLMTGCDTAEFGEDQEEGFEEEGFEEEGFGEEGFGEEGLGEEE